MNHIKKDQFSDLRDQFFSIKQRASALSVECARVAANVIADLDTDDYMQSLNACRIYYTAERAVYGAEIAFSGLRGDINAKTNALCQLENGRTEIWNERLESRPEARMCWRRYDYIEKGSKNELKEVYASDDLQETWDKMFLRAAVVRKLAADIGERLVLKGKAVDGEIEPFLTEANRSREAKKLYEQGERYWYGKLSLPKDDETKNVFAIVRPDDLTSSYAALQLGRRCYTGPDQVGALEAIRWAILDEMFVFGPDGREVSAQVYDAFKVAMGRLAMQEAKKTVSEIMKDIYPPLD